MRIDRLELRAFGPFTDQTLDLSRGAQGLHLVFGDNEAGKSSALRALGDLLFGIPARTRDDFIHGYSELRIGATIRAQDRRTLAFVRRKANKNPLWNASDDQAIADESLDPFVRGMDRADFERVFGLDHMRLREGAHALLDATNGGAAAIAGSGLGIPELRSVQRALDAEAEALYSARARTKPINELQKRIKALRTEILELSVTGATWDSCRIAVERAHLTLDAAKAEASEVERQRSRLLMLRRVREPVSSRRAARARLPATLVVPDLAEDVVQRRRDFETEIAETVAAHDAATRRLAELREQLAGYPTQFVCLDHEEVIEELRNSAATVKKALEDLPKREFEHAAQLGERDSIAASLGIETTEERVRELRSKSASGPDTSAVEKALREAQRLGDVEAGLRERAVKHARLATGLAEGLARFQRLTGFTSDLNALAVHPIVGAATIDDFVGRFERSDSSTRDLKSEQDRLRADHDATIVEIEAATRAGAIPAESDLVTARGVRSKLWKLVRRTWLIAEDVKVEVRQLDSERALPEAFEHAAQAADGVADALRAESTRMATAAELARRIHTVRGQLEANARKREAALNQRSDLDAAWTAAWTSSGLTVQSPERMREAVNARDALLAKRDELRGTDDEATSFEGRVADAVAGLSRALSLPLKESISFGDVLARAERWLEGERRLQSAVTSLLAHHDAAAVLAHRISTIRADAAQFQSDARRVAAKCDHAGADDNPHGIAIDLARKMNAEREQRARRGELVKQIEAVESELRNLVTEQRSAADRLAALCREAGVDNATLLPAVEQCAQAERALRSEGARSLDDLEALVDEYLGVDLEAALTPLTSASETASAEVERCLRLQVEAQYALDAIDGTPHAAAKAQEAQATVAKLRNEVARYLRTALASRLLATGVERYRQMNEAPLLKLASRHFAGLTRDRHTAIRSDVDDRGAPFLLVRSRKGQGSVELRIEDLSDGTRDQLHLALVLGSLEHRFAHEEPRPLILDDVLVHFDDDRSAAALAVLAEFSKKTQVLLFTHHGRIREQAQALGEARDVFVHVLHQ